MKVIFPNCFGLGWRSIHFAGEVQSSSRLVVDGSVRERMEHRDRDRDIDSSIPRCLAASLHQKFNLLLDMSPSYISGHGTISASRDGVYG